MGSVLAGFRLGRPIGRGGNGAVFAADQLSLGREVAIKVLLADQVGDESARLRFERESNLAASIEHPHIIPIYDAGTAEGWLYIAMKLVRGSDLQQVLSAGPLEPRRGVTVVSEMAEALDAAHARGLVHRDVKPGNVLLETTATGRQHSYLADFGLVRHVSAGSKLTVTGGDLLGTPGYISPEQVERRDTDARTDVYALGCMLYECLTGQLPFGGENYLALLNAHLNQPPPKVTTARPGLPVALDEVIAKAMAKSPDDRYARCGELAREARSALEASRRTQFTRLPPLPPPPAGGGAPAPAPSPSALAPAPKGKPAAAATPGSLPPLAPVVPPAPSRSSRRGAAVVVVAVIVVVLLLLYLAL
ncbi:MAG: serine/threonine-protein kinase [Acidimicrobiales bacterium]